MEKLTENELADVIIHLSKNKQKLIGPFSINYVTIDYLLSIGKLVTDAQVEQSASVTGIDFFLLFADESTINELAISQYFFLLQLSGKLSSDEDSFDKRHSILANLREEHLYH